ncbi:hypothetical protein [Kribbella sp. NPDC051718]|uniref:hypothetical protein n=1 Tax=Kribbella sp. NPDC051718 TaxID=3155168 RepID=UPI003413AF84
MSSRYAVPGQRARDRHQPSTSEPLLFWFDLERQLSFGWSGRYTNPISVLAHADLKQDHLTAPPGLVDVSVVEALGRFERTCRTWQKRG